MPVTELSVHVPASLVAEGCAGQLSAASEAAHFRLAHTIEARPPTRLETFSLGPHVLGGSLLRAVKPNSGGHAAERRELASQTSTTSLTGMKASSPSPKTQTVVLLAEMRVTSSMRDPSARERCT